MYDGLNCSTVITNMSDEMFNDALFYREMADNTKDFFLQWRYRRSAIIFFCASAEAWMNMIIQYNLQRKEKLTTYEKMILSFIKNYKSEMPKGFNNIRNKLYNFIPEAINGKRIDWNKNRQITFENYITLSNMRNNVVHYATKSRKEVYSESFIDLIQQAPDIIENLFKQYTSMGSKLDVPRWYKQRKSRIIK